MEGNRTENDIKDNKFRFLRSPFNEKLNNSVITFLLDKNDGKESNEIYVDYGTGEKTHLIDTYLPDSYFAVDDEKFERIDGKYKYTITTGKFTNNDDFNKFRASRTIKYTPTADMLLRVYPETHETVFLSLAAADIKAKFRDSDGNTDVNSFSKNLSMETSEIGQNKK